MNMSNDGSTLDVVQNDAQELRFYFRTYYEQEYYEPFSSAAVTLNDVRYIFVSRETLMSTGFQGALASGELGWDGVDSVCGRITICPQTMQTLAVP